MKSYPILTQHNRIIRLRKRLFLGVLPFLLVYFTALGTVEGSIEKDQKTKEGPKKIIIFGAGYVGCVSGGCWAKCGHKITFIEPNEDKIVIINGKKSPVLELHLDELIQQGVEVGLIEAKSKLGEEILDADIAMIAVGTPSTEEGLPQLDFLENVLSELEIATKKRTKPLIVCIRSTILPTTFRDLKKKYINLTIVVNPEFIRESTAVDDFFHPALCVAGGDDSVAVNTVLSLYENICQKRFAVSGESACLIKYACNAFHATKIAFTNEIATLCDSLGMDSVELMETFSEDSVLNCSSAYFKPGFSFGGSCLGKDLRALISAVDREGGVSPLLSAILPSNQYRFQKIAETILQGHHGALAVLGMSYKMNSDDLRESPFLELINFLYQKGISLRVFDPDVRQEQLVGENHEILTQQFEYLIPSIKSDLSSTLEGCDGVVVCKDLLEESYRKKLMEEGIPIYDLGYFFKQKRNL